MTRSFTFHLEPGKTTTFPIKTPPGLSGSYLTHAVISKIDDRSVVVSDLEMTLNTQQNQGNSKQDDTNQAANFQGGCSVASPQTSDVSWLALVLLVLALPLLRRRALLS